MVNKRKVRLMARTAMYEKHEGKRELKNVMYYRSDYIGMHMLFAGIGITGGYLLTLMLICAYRFEYIVNNLTKMDYRGLGSTLIVSYVLLLIVAQVISYFIFSMRRCIQIFHGDVPVINLLDLTAFSVITDHIADFQTKR